MRKLDWGALILVIVVAVIGKFTGFGEAGPGDYSPRRPNPEHFEPLFWQAETQSWLQAGTKNLRPAVPYAPSSLPSEYIDDGDRVGSSTGSAFSVSSRGYWLTARHVIEGCDEAYLQTGDQAAVKVYDSFLHPKADVALLVTTRAPEGLSLSAGGAVKRNSFNVGFPKGQPGAVHGQFLGEMTVRHQGRRRYRERVDAWSIVSEIPHKFASLGGLSGGAVIDDGGKIIGIVQSESPRRGRFMTARPEALREMIEFAGIDIPMNSKPAAGAEISEANYQSIARRLIVTLRVSKVWCLVN